MQSLYVICYYYVNQYLMRFGFRFSPPSVDSCKGPLGMAFESRRGPEVGVVWSKVNNWCHYITCSNIGFWSSWDPSPPPCSPKVFSLAFLHKWSLTAIICIERSCLWHFMFPFTASRTQESFGGERAKDGIQNLHTESTDTCLHVNTCHKKEQDFLFCQWVGWNESSSSHQMDKSEWSFLHWKFSASPTVTCQKIVIAFFNGPY